MSVYKSSEVNLPASANEIFAKISNMDNLKNLINRIPADKIPDEQRKAFESIDITDDSITFPAGPVGSMTFKMSEKIEPTLVKLTGEGSPVPLSIAMHVIPESTSSSKGFVEIDIEIPALLKPMIGGQIQKMADQFGDMLKAISFS